MGTLLTALRDSLDGAGQGSGDRAKPVAVLWTDADAQWLGLLPRLRAAMPNLHTLGAYDPGTRTGPAIWLRCVVDGRWDDKPTPVLYLPRVSRQQLHATGDCPAHLVPLIELQFRGQCWHQINGRDWSVFAFLSAGKGLDLEIAQDRRTEEAMLRVLELLAEVDAGVLRGRRLDADDFDKLSVSDPVRDLLRWMSAAEAFEASNKGNRWESFRNVCRAEFAFDPDEEGVHGAGSALATGKGAWATVWRRFCEAPGLYPGIGRLLSEPARAGQSMLALDGSRNPKSNEDDEGELRSELEVVGGLAAGAAAARLL